MSLALLDRQSERPSQTRLAVVDCDIHPTFRSEKDILPYLPARWREHMLQYRRNVRQGLHGTLTHPRMQVNRVDAVTPDGGPPGSDVEFMRTHHLDTNNVEWGLLQALQPAAHAERNLEFGAALASANNDWQIAQWAMGRVPEASGALTIVNFLICTGA